MAGRPESPLDPSAGHVQRFAADLRKLRVDAGSPTYRVMAQRSGHGASTLSQAAAGERLPTLPVALAYVKACGGDPEEWESRWREAAAEVAAEPRTEDEEAEPPYRGLARFEPSDAALFFGRDQLIDELVALTARARLTAVVGASGSGKSSLVRAGLVPRLRSTEDPRLRPATVRIITPGDHPLRTHGERLTAVEGSERDTWLVVDQFEEIYTLCTDREERALFVDRLLAALDPANRLRVLIAVRADFFGRLAGHRPLADALRDATLLTPPMSRDEFGEAIVKPAQAAGHIVERTLTARIVAEVESEPGALPLMSHALLETWRRRKGRALTEAAYEAAGGLHGAIARTAEQAFGGLTTAQADRARRMLLRLVTPGDGTQDTRRPADRAELVGPGPGKARDDAALVLERLARARLITLDGDTVDLAHEAVITAWPRLRGWIDAERDRLRAHRQLTEAARVWRDLDRDPGALYRGTRLATAQEIFAAPEQRGDLTELEWSFLSAGLAAAEQERLTAARTARRTRTFVAALSVVVVLAVVAALVAWQQNRSDERRRMEAEARRVAAVAESLRPTEPRTALRLSLAAWKVADLPETRSALLGSLAQPNQDAFRLPGLSDAASVDLSADGRLAVAVEEGQATRWDVRAHRRLSSFHVAESTDDPSLSMDRSLSTRMVLSPDGRTLAVGTGRDVNLYDVPTGKPTGRLPDVYGADLSFGPSGRTLLLAVTADNSPPVIRLWDVRRHKLLFKASRVEPAGVPADLGWLRGSSGNVAVASALSGVVAVSADDRFLADCSHDRLEIWDVGTHHRSPGSWTSLRGPQCMSAEISFVPGAHEFAVTTDRGVRIWDVPSGRERTGIGQDGLDTTAYTPDGRFVIGSDGGQVFLWRLDAPQAPVFRAPVAGAGSWNLRLDRHDGVIRYVSNDASPTVWSLSLGHAFQPGFRPDGTTSAAFSPDGRLLAVARQSGGRHRLRLIDVAHNTEAADELPTAPCPVAEGEPTCTDIMAFSPDGRTMVYSTTDNDYDSEPALTVVNSRRPARPATFGITTRSDEGPTVESLALDSEGNALVSLNGERTERWDTRRHVRTGRWRGVAGESLALRDDGRLLVSLDGHVTDLTSGRTTRHTLTQTTPTVVAFTHDGTRLAAGDDSGWVSLWDGHARRRLGELPADSSRASDDEDGDGVSAMTFSHDGTTLAVGTDDGLVRLWDASTGLAIGSPLYSTGGPVEALAFGGDDRALYLSSEHVPLERYDIAPDTVAADICRRVGTGLSRSQWGTYVRDVPYRGLC
ncbi:DNA-binding protein [Streptomyces sp. NPDC001843]|uniref:nSTAND1 domain-containing NTPase n=1 Tax=Streptomyces sp. NPDC001843 TaxID=3364617 RepID=UPI00367C6620